MGRCDVTERGNATDSYGFNNRCNVTDRCDVMDSCDVTDNCDVTDSCDVTERCNVNDKYVTARTVRAIVFPINLAKRFTT